MTMSKRTANYDLLLFIVSWGHFLIAIRGFECIENIRKLCFFSFSTVHASKIKKNINTNLVISGCKFKRSLFC